MGEKKDSLTLYIHEENIGASSFLSEWQQEEAQIKKISVDITTLDLLISQYGHPKFCKIDVEGFELSVLKGLTSSINVLCFEYHLDRGESEIQKTIACLYYLSELTDTVLKVNVIPGSGKTEFFRKNWWDLPTFIDFFQYKLCNYTSFAYGDIFVRM
ncbi:MAG: FkbM family methyltransferase [Cyanobacteria bacterium]|nr:FkbM family methyltransferase [Cyanobacteria bacterium GSL.Bin1]